MKPGGKMWYVSGKNPFNFVADPDQGIFFTFFNTVKYVLFQHFPLFLREYIMEHDDIYECVQNLDLVIFNVVL